MCWPGNEACIKLGMEVLLHWRSTHKPMAEGNIMKLSATLAWMLGWIITSPLTAQTQQFNVNVGRGDVPLYAPANYDGTQSLPLIVGLHGYSSSPEYLEPYFDLLTQIESREFLYLVPIGTSDFVGNHFWAATDACCNFQGSGVDDSAYLRTLVDNVRSNYSVDDQSIHFAGHSNGGFMSHRMAIDHADLVASIASLAGANFADSAAYNPSDSVHMLQVHGTSDAVIRFNGGNILGRAYPGAVETSSHWAEYNGMNTASTEQGSFDLDLAVPGDETTSFVWDVNNDQGTRVELWRMNNSAHSPAFGDNAGNLFAPRVVDWLLSHRKADRCDFDASGGCDVADIDDLVAAITSLGQNPNFDLNNDGLVNLADRDLWLSLAGESNLGVGRSYLLGDANLDGTVDGVDFLAWNDNKFSSRNAWSAGDFDANGVVDGRDFIEWNNNKFLTADTAVPEPITGIHLLCALLLPSMYWRTNGQRRA